MTVRYRVLNATLALALTTGCAAGSPAGPEPGDDTSGIPPGSHLVTGVALSAVDDAPASGTTLTVNGTVVGRADASGAFRAGFPSSDVVRTSLAATGFIERQTGIRAPSQNLSLSLIPSAFDLTAFDQMFRHSSVGLTRWSSAPALVVERRVLQFTDVNASSYTALDETLTDDEVSSIAADMVAGLAALTAGRLGAFTAVTSQQAAPGATVTPRQDRKIVVTRQVGLTKATDFWGYARWSTLPDGEVTSGVIILDRDFERSSSVFRRALRMHELGHALGLQHVTGRGSVMNSDARTEPNDFDRHAARIAYRRPPGNRTPDIDPTSHAATTLAGSTPVLLWHGAH